MTPPARDLAWAVEWAKERAASAQHTADRWPEGSAVGASYGDEADALRLLLGAAEDAGRLDWIEANPSRLTIFEMVVDGLRRAVFSTVSPDGEGALGPRIRPAIDAARATPSEARR